MLVTRREDGALAIAVWNYVAPEEAGSPRDVEIEMKGVTGAKTLRITTVDAAHGSPQALWQSMGRPSFPTREQQKQLRAAGQMPAPELRKWRAGSPVKLTLAPKALVLIEVLR